MPRIQPITFDPANAFVAPHGITQQQFDSLGAKLNACRRQMIGEDLTPSSGGKDTLDPQPPDGAGWHELPERMLDHYQSDRANSELDQVLKTAKRLSALVDKVLVLGSGQPFVAAGAMMQTCCAPYHNEMTRGQRGGRPRMYFAGDHADNDWTQALLQFLQADSRGDGPEGNWGIVVISKNGDALDTSAATPLFMDALKSKVGENRLSQFVALPPRETQTPAGRATEINGKHRDVASDGSGERFGVFAPMRLLPAAVLGIDIVKMLEAACAMNTHFQTAKFGENAVMDYVAVNYLSEVNNGSDTRVLSVWNKSLEATSLWYDQLLTGSLAKRAKNILPLIGAASADAPVSPQSGQKNQRNNVVHNVTVNSWRQEPLAIGKSQWNQAPSNKLADKTLPQIVDAAVKSANLAYKEQGRPTTDIHLPAADEVGLGQLFQMLMLATVMEGRLLGVNADGSTSAK